MTISPYKRQSHNWFGSDILNSLTDDVSTLQPLANTMTKALTDAGIKPPSELNDLAATFHSQIVDPANKAVSSGQLVNNILGYVQQQMTAQSSGSNLNKVQTTVANGGNKVLNNLTQKDQFTTLFSNPFVWVAIVAVVIIGIIVATTK